MFVWYIHSFLPDFFRGYSSAFFKCISISTRVLFCVPAVIAIPGRLPACNKKCVLGTCFESGIRACQEMLSSCIENLVRGENLESFRLLARDLYRLTEIVQLGKSYHTPRTTTPLTQMIHYLNFVIFSLRILINVYNSPNLTEKRCEILAICPIRGSSCLHLPFCEENYGKVFYLTKFQVR